MSLSPSTSPATPDTWRTRVLSHVGGTPTVKKIGKDAGIAAVFAIGGWLTSDDGPLKDASPNTKRLVNLAFGAPMLAKMELPELQKTWKERELPDFVMHGLTTAIAALGIGTNDRDMITSAAMLSTLFSMAGHLEDGVQAKSYEGIKALEKSVPEKALMRDGGKQVALAEVDVGQHVVVEHGRIVPVDGIVTGIEINGKPASLGAVHMPRALDGEGKQLAVTLGGAVPQGAVTAEGTHLVVQAKAKAADSAISRNIHYLSEAEEQLAHNASQGIKHNIKTIYVPIMLAACAGEFAWTYYKHQKKHALDGSGIPAPDKKRKDVSVEKLVAKKLGLEEDKDEDKADGKSGGEEKKKDGHGGTTGHVRKSLKRTAELAIKMAPCAIMASLLVIPFVKNALAARHGVMVRDDAALDKMRHITHVLSDIRGTLTTGLSAFKGLHVWDEAAGALKMAEKGVQHELLGMMGKAQTASTHELAASVRLAAAEGGHDLRLLDGETAVSAITKGVVGTFKGGHELVMGGRAMMEAQGHALPQAMLKAAEAHGGDVAFFRHAQGGQVRYGIAHFKDELRPGVKDAIDQMRKNGTKIVLVTGMPKKSAEAVLQELDTRNVPHNPIELRADCLPIGKKGALGKDDVVREFSSDKHVIAGIGDGENDAAFMSLVKKNGGIGMAIASTGAAVTKDTASIVVEGIHQLPDLMALSRNLSHALWLNVGLAASWMGLLVGSHVAGYHMKTQTASLAHELPTFALTLASLGQSLKMAKGMPLATVR